MERNYLNGNASVPLEDYGATSSSKGREDDRMMIMAGDRDQLMHPMDTIQVEVSSGDEFFFVVVVASGNTAAAIAGGDGGGAAVNALPCAGTRLVRAVPVVPCQVWNPFYNGLVLILSPLSTALGFSELYIKVWINTCIHSQPER
ncbi:hypothetical protein RRG08_011302 [Elysia crispata]|uniref:Uncharacterized protein n=1 Tax=Elysia crispata TaxID=231223 RepID=A0AAE0YG13_9GAST|nr:hypothetical protein RRG08_011302 [Elysia crispata]